MQSILGIDLASYKPVEPLGYYAQLKIIESGSIRPNAALSDDIIKFLESSGAEVSLWDGSKGVLGREYITNRTCLRPMTEKKIANLRLQYIALKRKLAFSEPFEKLKKDLETQTRMFRELGNSVFFMERKAEGLRNQRDEYELQKGVHTDAYLNISKRCADLQEELAPCKIAAARVSEKLQKTKLDVAEAETRLLRRMALLRGIFDYDVAAADLVVRSRTLNSTIDKTIAQAKVVDQRSCEISQTYLQMKRFYIDAKTGLKNLFSVESGLKDILQHLRDGLESIRVTERTPTNVTEQGIDVRLRHVRKLWNAANTNFLEGLPYIEKTSLRRAGVPESGERMRGRPEGGKRVGVFVGDGVILPNFVKVELQHALSRRSRIIALHRCAAEAYKDINVLYDFQKALIEEGLQALLMCEREQAIVNKELIDIWEELLDIPGI